MTEKRITTKQKFQKLALRAHALFLIGFFLVMTLLTAFVVIPQINNAFEKQHAMDSAITLEIETELFNRFVANHRLILEGLAKFPVMTSAALLSKSDNPDFLDLVNNFSIFGERSRLIVQNIAGEIIYQTATNIHGNFTPDASWAADIIDGRTPYNFQLIEQEGHEFRFALSIPITYRGHIEGLLSAEITAPLENIFSPKTIKEGSAFKITQGDVVVQTNASNILRPREVHKKLPFANLELTYISDNTQVLYAQSKIRNTILIALFSGLGISFILFTLFGFRTLTDTAENKGVHQNILNRAYLIPLIVGFIGISASIAAHLILDNLHHQKIHQEILTENTKNIVAIQNKLAKNLEVLDPLKSFFDASSHVERAEFKSFVEPLIKNNSAIQALEWIPKIKNSERVAYENAARKDGFPNFNIIERNDQGAFSIAPERDTYFPVYYVEPLAGNEKVLGLDSPFNTRRANAIKQAMLSGQSTAAGTFKLIQDTKEQLAFLVFKPIYEGRANYNSEAERQEHFKGLVLIVLRVGDVIANALNADSAQTEIFIKDITDAKNPEVIFGALNEDLVDPTVMSRTTLGFSGRQWQITALPRMGGEHDVPLLPWVTLFIGFTFTIFITYTFIQLIRRHRVIEGVVQKRTQEIQESKQFRDLIMSNIPDVLFVKDTEFKIVDANPAFFKLYPKDQRNSLIGTTTIESFNKEEADAFLEHDREALKSGSSETEETLHFPDGRTRTLLTKKTRFEDIHNTRFILGVSRDITNMKKAEEEILRSNLELERFAYVASHDLQEPLRMVTNFTGLLKKRYENELDEQANQYLDFAFDGAKRMQDLVSDLLDYSRIGQEAENFRDVDINNTMQMIQDNLIESITETKAQITYAPLPTVHSSPIRLIRLLQNIIGNAIKYQAADMQPIINVTCEKKGDMWLFAVTDNGIGMKQEYCEKIFQPFQRLHAKNEYAGTGMGLAICRKIAEGFGGKMWAESKLGNGSTFYFTIPAYNQKPKPEKDGST